MRKSTIVGIVMCVVLTAAIVLFGVFFTVNKINVRFVNDVTVADKKDVLSSIKLDDYTNIVTISEKKLKEQVEGAFPGNTIEVTNVERTFPNVVTVVVRERTPLFKIAVKGKSTYAAADRDFRRNSVYTADELAGRTLITVSGFEVVDSFAVAGCYRLKEVADGLVASGFSDEGILAFLTSVEFKGDDLILTLFDGATFIVGQDNVKGDLAKCYASYLNDSYLVRSGKNYVA